MAPNFQTLLRSLAFAGLSALAVLHAPAQAASAPQLEVYNPDTKAIFPVSSVLVLGQHDAMLIDAQFQRNDAQALVSRIQASGKTLKTIYISHSDPDYYFGLDVLHAAFPRARILATPQTVDAIRSTMQGKLAFWGPILKENAPHALVLPSTLRADHLMLEHQRIEIKGLTGASPDRSYLWIPALRTVAGGVVVSAGIHVWVADTQSPESRQHWLQTLADIRALQPARVIPGHFLNQAPAGLQAVEFTHNYITAFEEEASKAPDAAALTQAMQTRYPGLGEAASLALSAKVIKGEMKWPQ
jgi:glyoxylase-like metal-dependent hydrolase (beta-lactamase superfamily II)